MIAQCHRLGLCTRQLLFELQEVSCLASTIARHTSSAPSHKSEILATLFLHRFLSPSCSLLKMTPQVRIMGLFLVSTLTGLYGRSCRIFVV